MFRSFYIAIFTVCVMLTSCSSSSRELTDDELDVLYYEIGIYGGNPGNSKILNASSIVELSRLPSEGEKVVANLRSGSKVYYKEGFLAYTLEGKIYQVVSPISMRVVAIEGIDVWVENGSGYRDDLPVIDGNTLVFSSKVGSIYYDTLIVINTHEFGWCYESIHGDWWPMD